MHSPAIVIVVDRFIGGFTPGFSTTWGLLPGYNSFFNLPRTEAAVKTADGWTADIAPDNILTGLNFYCYECKELCLWFDDNGHVAALQVAVASSNFTNYPYNWGVQGFYDWNTTVNGVNATMKAKTIYFITEELLTVNASEREAAYNTSNFLQYGAIWVTGTDGNITEIPSNTKKLVENNYTKQACIIGMGVHYYYNMTNTTECSSRGMTNFFPLTKGESMIGVGFMLPGKRVSNGCSRTWFETPSEAAVKAIVTDGPKCLYESVKNNGTITLHINFISYAYTTLCL